MYSTQPFNTASHAAMARTIDLSPALASKAYSLYRQGLSLHAIAKALRAEAGMRLVAYDAMALAHRGRSSR